MENQLFQSIAQFNCDKIRYTKKLIFQLPLNLLFRLKRTLLMTSGELIRKSEISSFDAWSSLAVPCRMVNIPAITAEEPRSSSWILNYAKSPSILTEFSGEMYSLEAAYVSFQFHEAKHPKLPKAFGSTILFFVHSQNAPIVIRTYMLWLAE